VPKFFSIKYPSGEKYSGYFSPDWEKEVFGIQINKDGSKYVGMFKNGMYDGRGRLILHKGDYYEGDFKENKANGFGKYVNSKGEIYIGNVNLKDISSESISDNITYVSQQSYVFNDTLKNNIILNRNISYKEYEKVIDICNLNNLRNSKKLRNNFLIEDNGFNISGGEKQKIVLARSLLKDSNYIILDEALSEVGINEEKDIIKKIFLYFKDKTIIYISHKKEIIDMFDLKYKLERRKG
jgi:ABC-type iron transport system FetAB ATPase subunit